VGSPEVFSRVYHKLADEFPEVYDSDDLGGYVRLLVAADQAWPASARWAGLVNKATLARLVASSLVERHGSRYRIRGLDNEREARSHAGRNAARMRWALPTHSDGNADAMPRTEQKRKEESKENLRERPIARARENGDLEPVAAIIPRAVKP
jgi:hypothetical protein